MRAEVAIVGNGVAGTACAMRLARHGIRPLLIGPCPPVDRPSLAKSALADGALRLLADEERLAEHGVDRLARFVPSGAAR
jgi:2-polyprenyl-6-methoxyphenol hydroxylase-like FAD-dependent oxidoreductase